MFFLLIFISTARLNAQEQMSTQTPYSVSVGGMISPLCPNGGASFKTFFTNNMSFQADIYFKTMLTGAIKEGYAIYSSCVINTNFMYQKKLKEQKTSELFWFIGGGISLGCTMAGNAKFGTNTIVGLEYVFKIPLTIQIDMRPGYGMLFSSDNELKGITLHSTKNPWSHFDWLLGLTLRYTLKNKNQ